MTPCTVEPTNVGWWVRFPADPQAGLLLASDGEKMMFARDCGVDLHDRELLLALDLGEIVHCPDIYYAEAKTFPEEPYW